ncbi:DUF4817 domain-containing protein [Trichonephila clavipes]|nr:DUF4817 domain-containing protein [Trichonephila clavipes]
MEWCHARGNWAAAEWNQVVFSKEFRFNLSSDANRVRLWRPRDERLNHVFALQRHTASTAGAMLWDFIAYNTRSLLVLIRGTMTALRYGHPSYCTIAIAVHHLYQTGSYHRRIPLSRATHLQRIPAEDVLGYALAHPEISVRDIGMACSYSSTVWNILHTYGAYTYHPVLAQKLMPGNQDHRFDFCNFVLNSLDENPDFLMKFFGRMNASS